MAHSVVYGTQCSIWHTCNYEQQSNNTASVTKQRSDCECDGTTRVTALNAGPGKSNMFVPDQIARTTSR